MESYLPLRVSPSKYGLGVFATKIIPPNSLICSYLGEVKEDNGLKGDSVVNLFQVGITKVVLDPGEHTNVGRYLNSSLTHHTANCVMQIVPIQRNGQIEFALILIARERIKMGEELLWYYG